MVEQTEQYQESVSGTPFDVYTTPVTTTTTYTLVSVSDGGGTRNSGFTDGSATITINSLPTVTFSAQPGAGPDCAGINEIYTTQSSMTNYAGAFLVR